MEGGLAPASFKTLLFLIATLVFSVFPQNLPNEIHGYKVYRDTVTVSTDAKAAESGLDAFVKIGEPDLIHVDISGVTFELSGEFRSLAQSGKVDFLSFKDFRVNGVSVEIEEYKHKFDFRKGETIILPKPARILLPTTGIIQTAWKEMRESQKLWTVTGRVFVFGRFRRYGFLHKRVVPVDIDIKISNPMQ